MNDEFVVWFGLLIAVALGALLWLVFADLQDPDDALRPTATQRPATQRPATKRPPARLVAMPDPMASSAPARAFDGGPGSDTAGGLPTRTRGSADARPDRPRQRLGADEPDLGETFDLPDEPDEVPGSLPDDGPFRRR